jgi:adenine-specific DNA-methyltransferase
MPPNGCCWRWTKEKAEQAIKENRLRPNNQTGKPEYFIPATNKELVNNLWNDFNAYSFKYNYPTEKNEALLDRIIKASSNEGDLVLDCFCGSGTTAAVSEKLNRRWIACDLGRFAIHTTRKRLLGIPNVKPFIVQNLGKYERQQWMGAEFQDVTERAAIEQRYRHFILQLYHAEPVSGYSWLHGAKAGRMVHIGSVDAPVAIGDVKNIVQEFWKSVGKSKDIAINGVDILGWEFAFEINETAKQYAAANNVDLKFRKIPTEVLEKRAVEQGDIKFYELASLSVETELKGEKLMVRLSDFIVPPDDIPEDVRESITHWQQWVDYWAVDWNFRDDTFHNEWQSYRTKKDPTIDLQVTHTYENKGTYQVVIKVIDILGNDTTKILSIEV